MRCAAHREFAICVVKLRFDRVRCELRLIRADHEDVNLMGVFCPMPEAAADDEISAIALITVRLQKRRTCTQQPPDESAR
jgi:hypothetical protein